MSKKLKGVLSFLLAMSMILSQSFISEASEKKSSVFVKELKVDHSNYFGTFTIAKNSLKKIIISVSPKNADIMELEWKSSNKSVVTVSKSGVIKGIKEGKANIIVSATDGSKVKQTIKVVVGKPVKTITANSNELTLTEGSKSKLSFTVKPADATDKTLVYRSSDNKIATVSETGEVKAVAAGEATITAVAKDGSSKKAVVNVTVKELKVNQTLTDKDVVNGKIIVSDKIVKNLRIDKSVGSANITLDHVTVVGNLEMENDAKYTVYAKNSDINKVVALEENADEIRSFAIGDAAETESVETEPVDTPTFVAEEGTLVIAVDARGNISVKQGNTALIGTVSVTRKLDGDIELKLEGFNGNLVVTTESNANIAITTTACNIPEATISGKSTGQRLTLTDNTAKGEKSTVGKINVETNAKLKLDVPAKELVIAETVESADVTVEKPIEKIVNEGKATELAVNSNVNNIVSTGEKLEMKVAAGSQVASVDAQGASSKIEVALGSTISNVVSSGTASEISGSGTIKEVKVEGNNTVINNRNAKVTVAAEVTGTTSNGSPVSGGTTITTPIPTQVPPVINNPIPPQPPVSTPITPTPTVTPTPSPTPTPGITPPETGTVITISDPGKIIAGNEVQLEADLDQVAWSVYNYMEDTSGFAEIDASTGILYPYSTGVVRVVATSTLNQEVYGAVDITIYGKKFVRCEPLETVEINTDLNISDIEKLSDSGLLPTEVNLVYETGSGTDTETITAELYNYYGEFYGNRVNTYQIKCYPAVPSGYEDPYNLKPHVFVKLNTPQTDLRKIVTGLKAPAETLRVTSDEHFVYFSDLYNEYFGLQNVALSCEDGSEVDGMIIGWYGDIGSLYNGSVPGNYEANFRLSIPFGYKYRLYQNNGSRISWYDSDSMQVDIPIIIEAPQTPVESPEYEMPDTTQPKFYVEQVVAEIEEVSLIGAPDVVNVSEVIDFSQYVTVTTDSELMSDHRVNWTVNGYQSYDLDPVTGIGMFRQEGDYNITAASAVDSTKKANITVHVADIGSITPINSIAPITITEDLHIKNLNGLYEYIKNSLPDVLTGESDTGELIQLPVKGWYLSADEPNQMRITPELVLPYGYQMEDEHIITINFTVPQTDNRVKVVNATLVTTEYILSEDEFAVTEDRLFDAICSDRANFVVQVNAELEDGSTEVLECKVRDFRIKRENLPEGFYGLLGSVPVVLGIVCPDEYTAMNKYNDYCDFGLTTNVRIEAEQTPRYEDVWVNRKPKLEYSAGETIDLSLLTVRVRDNTQPGEYTDEFIGYNDFASHNIILYLDNPENRIMNDTVITGEMNGKFIHVSNTLNDYTTSFGPLHVTGGYNVINGFETWEISNGAVIGGLYHDSLSDLLEYALPDEVNTTGDNSIAVPVHHWYNTDNYPSTGLPTPGSYTFTAELDTNYLPEDYVIGNGVTATVEVLIHDNLSIESIISPTDKVVPLNEFFTPNLPRYIDVILSDGVRCNNYLEVEWDTSEYNMLEEGAYNITGTIISAYINDKNLKPSFTLTVDLAVDASAQFLNIVTLPNKLIYKTNEEFAPEGMGAILYYSDGSMTDARSRGTIAGFDSSSQGFKEITLTCVDKLATFRVYVEDMAEPSCTVLFVSDKNNMEIRSIVPGNTLQGDLPTAFKPGNMIFLGWFYDSECTVPFSPDTIILEDTVLFAKWM